MQGKDPEAKMCLEGPREDVRELRGAEGVQIPKEPPRPCQEGSFYSESDGEPSARSESKYGRVTVATACGQ